MLQNFMQACIIKKIFWDGGWVFKPKQALQKTPELARVHSVPLSDHTG